MDERTGLGGKEDMWLTGGRVLLDAYARRHEAQKIYLRQAAAQRWIEYREQVLQGGRPTSRNQSQLRHYDHQLRAVCFVCHRLSANPRHVYGREFVADKRNPIGASVHHR